MNRKVSWLVSLAALVGIALMGGGCQTAPRRAAAIGVGSAAGGGLGYAVSNKKPWAAVAGSAGGAALTQLALGEDSGTLQKGFDDGYMRGSSDAIKRQYWLLQAMNEPYNGADFTYYTVPVQGTTPDGKDVVRHTITVPIVQ